MADKIEVDVKQTRAGFDKIEALVESMVQKRILVGVPSSTAGNTSHPINNAELAYIHDNGAPEANIPARPFMHPGVDDVTPEIKQRLINIGRAAIEGRFTAVQKGMMALGQRVADSIKSRINSNTPPPLAPKTLANRKARGIDRTNTLVDTGQMRNSITYVIRDSE